MNQISRSLIFIGVCFTPIAALCDCDVQLPPKAAVPVESAPGNSWFGSDALAVNLPSSGKWRGVGPENSYGNKVWFWRRGFDAWAEVPPNLTITGVKLDSGKNPQRMEVRAAGGAMGGDSDPHAMVAGVNFPSAGCWELTATYVYLGIAQQLTFTVEVEIRPLTTLHVVK